MRDFVEAGELVRAQCAPLPPETVGVDGCLGRVPAADGRSAVDLPPFDRSAMDGYAVRSADVVPGALLPVAGALAAGDDPVAALRPGTVLSITTGAALPEGADAVLQSELAERVDGSIRVTRAVGPGRHVRRRGEDVRRGDVLAPAGRRVTLQRLSALASAGVGELSVHRRARVRVLATGSELLPLGAPPQPGRIHESNRVVLARLVERCGADLLGDATVPDDPVATQEQIAGGLSDTDVLLVSGGVSVGTHDHVKRALDACGVEEVFWRVRLKPGKPLWFGRRQDTLVFGLPGNPLSALACFLAFVEPALRRLHGERDAALRTTPARLTVDASASDGRTTLLAATFANAADGVLDATPMAQQGSHLTGMLAAADGFVVVPHDAGPLPAGSLVDAVPLD